MFVFLFYFVSSVICAVVAWWIYFTSTHFYKICVKIPGPKCIPVIGNFHQFLAKPEKFYKKVMEVSQEYYPIYRGIIGNICFVVIQDADDIHKVLFSNKTLSKAIPYNFMRYLTDGNIFNANREQWKRIYKIMSPTFSTQVIKTFIPILNEKSRILVDLLKEKANSQVEDIYHVMGMFALDSISQTSLGVDMKIQEENKSYLVDRIEKGNKLLQKCLLSPLYWFNTIYRHFKICISGKKMEMFKNTLIRTIINKKMQHYSNRTSKANKNVEVDKTGMRKLGFLDHVCEHSSQSNDLLSDKELENEVTFLAVAGTDTSALVLSTCLMLLGFYKDVQDKLVEELRSIFGEDIRRQTDLEDIRRMTYMEQVIKETMRLYPVSFIVGRHADEEIEVGGYVLPAGTNIFILPYLLHRDPRHFPDPLKFDPDRFTPENIAKRNSYSFIPFLSGSRICMGHYYAMFQMKVVLSHLLRNYEFLPCGTREEMEDTEMTFFLRLKHGYNVRFKLRQ